MSTTTTDEIQKLKFALLEAESRHHNARREMIETDVDIRVLRERLKLAEAGEETPAYPAGALSRSPAEIAAVAAFPAEPQAMPRTDLFGLKIDLTTEDRRAAARVLRRLAADIEEGDATGWTVSGIEGSAVATPFSP